jgi:hypothetical protein
VSVALLTASSERSLLIDEHGFRQGNEYDWDNYGPDGIHHLFAEHSKSTLCGMPLDALYSFPFRPTPLDTEYRCASCEAAEA